MVETLLVKKKLISSKSPLQRRRPTVIVLPTNAGGQARKTTFSY